jgi:hypothetical protein
MDEANEAHESGLHRDKMNLKIENAALRAQLAAAEERVLELADANTELNHSLMVEASKVDDLQQAALRRAGVV